MQDRTLCFLIRGDPPIEVLLGLKKTGFGAGKYVGIGGKVEPGEMTAAAAIRELEEETGIWVSESDLQRVGCLTFLFPVSPDWSQVVHVFLATTWNGDPVESREMMPAWFRVDDIPFEQMWQDNVHWLPRILAGERIQASFTFKADNETVDELEIEAWDGK
jgi:8-oxo-dGTP pyrophosphatase MutT (NUDIX family)